AVFVRLALRVDADASVQEHAKPRPRMRVEVRNAAGREVDAVAADDPVALGLLGQLPDERLPVDLRGAVMRLVALDVVDDAIAVLRPHAFRVLRELEDQWKYWPPSMTIVCPVTKSEPGPHR